VGKSLSSSICTHFEAFSNFYVHIPNMQRNSKLSNRGQRCIFLGYEEKTKSYQLWDLEDQNLMSKQSVVFDEACTTKSAKFVDVQVIICVDVV